ncbi:MAG: exonuclease subunit SbcD [Quadrisphaera sp.]
MRILHTSDWHLGRSFTGSACSSTRRQPLDALVEVVRSERVDAVVVAGDVYDRALPAVDAVEVLDDALHRLLGAGAQVLLTSGNHDSPARLGFGGRALERAGLHLRTRVADAARPVALSDAHGPVALYGIPYLEPGLVAGPLGVARSNTAVLGEVAGRVRADLAARRAGDGARGRTRAVLAAHAFVVGGEASGDERDITVGGVGSVPAGVLLGGPGPEQDDDEGPGTSTGTSLDYLALGHLHGRQVLAEHVRYSGSPLAYAFSEAGRTKGHWLLELGAAGVERVDAVDVTPPRPLALLRGSLGRAPERPRARARAAGVVPGGPHRPRAAPRAHGCAAHPLPARARPVLGARARRQRPSPAGLRRARRGPGRGVAVLLLRRPRARTRRRPGRASTAARRPGGHPPRAGRGRPPP